MTPLRVLILQQTPLCPPGIYDEVLAERGDEVVLVDLEAGEPIPDWRGFDALVVMGGGMGALDDAAHPFLPAERAAIGDAVDGGLPFWGVCLGAQLLAVARGAAFHEGAAPEGGPSTLRLLPAAADDPVFGPEGATMATFQTHRDTFDLPAGAVLLASTDACPNQVYRLGETAYGLQCHPEVDDRIVEEWLEYVPHVYTGALGPDGVRLVRERYADAGTAIAEHGRATFRRFLELAERRRRRPGG